MGTYKPNFNLIDSLKWGLGSAIAATAIAPIAPIAHTLAGALGFVGKSAYDVLQGTPFAPSQQRVPDAGVAHVGVTGGGDGRGSYFHKNLVGRYGRSNLAMFRWSDKEALRKWLKDAAKAGKTIRAYGHSYGGAALMQAIKHTGVPVETATTYDPVSWTDRVYDKPENVRTWTNYIPTPNKTPTVNDRIAWIGGNWGTRVSGSKIMPGYDHGNIVYADTD